MRSRLIHAPPSDAFLPFCHLSSPSFSFLSPRFPFFLSKGAALRNFTGIFAARVYFPPRIFQFRDFPLLFLLFLLSLSLFRSVFLAQLFPFDTGESRIERNALSAIVYYCSPLSFPRLLEENYVFLQLSKRTEVEGKWRSETFNTSALLLT